MRPHSVITTVYVNNNNTTTKFIKRRNANCRLLKFVDADVQAQVSRAPWRRSISQILACSYCGVTALSCMYRQTSIQIIVKLFGRIRILIE